VAGKIEPGESPVEAARREILEETGIKVGEPLGSMDPLYVREGKVLFKVYPFHFDAGDQEPVLNYENEDYRWASVEDAKGMKTVTDTILVMSTFLKQ
jgi:8-oxo-dGTP pyrophosphatase MutT (NUDIX family)